MYIFIHQTGSKITLAICLQHKLTRCVQN